jgi:hypothetical protein
MSETETTGAIDSGSADTSGSSVSISNSPTKEVKDKALRSMAESDDASDYIAERRDQEAEARGGDGPEQPHRKQERLDRFRRALNRARQEGEPSASQPQITQAEQPSDVPDTEAAIRHARADAQFELRAREFMKKDSAFEATCKETFSLFPPAPHLYEAILHSAAGPQILYEFAKTPEAIEIVNNMSPADASRLIATVEGHIMAMEDMKAQSARIPQRRQTSAPPPMRTPSGGASKPATSLHDLARRDDVSDFIAERRRQEQAKARR